MDKILNVGLAGFGLSGKVFHAPYIHANPRFNLKKVYERTKSLSREEYDYVEIVRSFEELLTEDIDLVVISLPNALHYPLAKQALEAGKNVLIEKPMAQTAEEAAELAAIAREKGLFLTAYQNRRFDGDFMTAKKLADEGRLGEVMDFVSRFDSFSAGGRRRATWRGTDKYSGAVYDLGVHVADQAVALFGLPDSIYADVRTEIAGGLADDNFTISMYFGNKRAQVSASRLCLEKGPRFEVHGTRGSYVKYGMDPQEPSLRNGARPGAPGFGEDREENWGVLSTWEDGTVTREKYPTLTGSYGLFYDNVYEAIVNGAPQAVPPEESAAVMRILEGALESAVTGRRIYFNK